MHRTKTLILIPGLLCDAAVWQHQTSALKDVARVHVADVRDCPSISSMAERVLLAHKGPLAIAGHSMGGRVALELVRRAPERVTKLALLDTGYKPLAQGAVGEQEHANRMALLAQAHEKGMRVMGREWARGMVHEDRVSGPMFEAILDMIERSTPARFHAQLTALLDRPDATDVLRHIACPTLLLCGCEDRWSPPSRHEEMLKLIPSAQLRIVEHCGHMSPMERPQSVSEALADWLRA